MRYGRYVTLLLILYMTVSTVKLWFADYDPYRTIFGLGWIFEFNAVEQWPAYTIALAILMASFFIPRFWCKYTCPLGGALSLISHISFLRIRRTESTCKSCALCSRPCPMGIAVEKADPLVNTNCIGCLECVDVCPRHGSLEVAFMPKHWISTLRGTANQPVAASIEQGEN
ncbi:MAG: 4Fe-4S binding protein [Anaerolineales bacterium]|nr:4Fe-4S binding protein [Anaerolineales bacterium]